MAASLGPGPSSRAAAWRCYPASQLGPDTNRTWIPHVAPAGICSRTDTLEAIVANCSGPVLPPACPPAPAPAPTPLPAGLSSLSRVFVGGTGGCVKYRTPSLVLLKGGSILAFTQCRQVGTGDTSPMEIHMKRSDDHGRSWSGPTTLPFSADPAHDHLGRAQTAYDARSGAVFLFDDPNQYPTVKDAVCSVHIWRSDDEGKSWHSVRNTTAPAELGSGLAAGVQLPNGRMVLAQRNGCNAHKADGAHALFSDDHGETWAAGQSTVATAAGDTANECQLAPLRNGSLLMIARNQAAQQRNRVAALSHDQGATWSALRVVHDLAGHATCEGSLHAPNGGSGNGNGNGNGNGSGNGSGTLYYSQPQGDGGARSRLTIRRSRDGGASWPEADSLVVHEGLSAYSCLGETALGELAVLWEADGADLMFATTKM
eukprot:g4129.t1